MIQPLRTAHRRVFVGLAVVLPAILIVGIAARPDEVQPVSRRVELPLSVYLMRKSDRLWRKHTIQTEFYCESQNPQKVYVVLKGVEALTEPDLLVYWTSKEISRDESLQDLLPANASLLGGAKTNVFLTLPQDARPGGRLVLYSLAHNKIVDAATVEKLP